MYKKDLILNNLQSFICHKTEPNQKVNVYYTQELFSRILKSNIIHK